MKHFYCYGKYIVVNCVDISHYALLLSMHVTVSSIFSTVQ